MPTSRSLQMRSGPMPLPTPMAGHVSCVLVRQTFCGNIFSRVGRNGDVEPQHVWEQGRCWDMERQQTKNERNDNMLFFVWTLFQVKRSKLSSSFYSFHSKSIEAQVLPPLQRLPSRVRSSAKNGIGTRSWKSKFNSQRERERVAKKHFHFWAPRPLESRVLVLNGMFRVFWMNSSRCCLLKRVGWKGPHPSHRRLGKHLSLRLLQRFFRIDIKKSSQRLHLSLPMSSLWSILQKLTNCLLPKGARIPASWVLATSRYSTHTHTAIIFIQQICLIPFFP